MAYACGGGLVPLGTTVDWRVGIADPGDGVARVTVEIPPAALTSRSSLTAVFPDLRTAVEARRHLPSITARLGDEALELERTQDAEGHTIRVTLQDSRAPIIIEYTLEPVFYPPGSPGDTPADARSRIAERLAVIRTRTLFPQLAIRPTPARITFDLLPRWSVIAPWPREGRTFTLPTNGLAPVEYLGLGPFEQRDVNAAGMIIRIAVAATGETPAIREVRKAVERAVDWFGPPPAQEDGIRTAVIVPNEVMRGGAAGARSIVQGPSPRVLTHEVLHWWTHADLVSADGRWFTEGFTEYYAIVLSRSAGTLSEQAVEACLKDLEREMRFLERNGAVSLVDAARRYGQNARARRLVYSKGALLALHLDRMTGGGRPLREAVRAVLGSGRTGLTSDALQDLLTQNLGAEADSVLSAYIDEGHRVPDLKLEAGPGSSDCARFP